MDATKREIRTIACELAIRELAPNEEGESRTIRGTAIVFDSESEVLDCCGTQFREIIKPEACTKEWLDTQDIKMNLLHDRNLTIARCNKGKGSLRLNVTERGVEFEFEAPKCDIGDRCLEMVRRGDYSGCSFEFYPKDYDTEAREGKSVLVIHRAFEALTALTIGMDPAYRQTTVNAREAWQQTDEAKAQEKAEKEAMERRMSAETKRRLGIMLRAEDFDREDIV